MVDAPAMEFVSSAGLPDLQIDRNEPIAFSKKLDAAVGY